MITKLTVPPQEPCCKGCIEYGVVHRLEAELAALQAEVIHEVHRNFPSIQSELCRLRAEGKRLTEDNERPLEAINAQWRTDCLRVAKSWKEDAHE